MILKYKDKKPVIGQNVFIAPTATIIGDVEIKDGASIWYGVVIRGDADKIRIGRNTNIQDNCTIHTDEGLPAIIGNRVSVGHNAVIHGCSIEDECLIGIHAVVLNGAKVMSGRGSCRQRGH
ncbi:MAG: gamma carbonic anhydrase family protein [Desulfobacterales bacterium]|nr:MAG: gamma carbonic anhydrase family protein [Desulfobacterales bacterium]